MAGTPQTPRDTGRPDGGDHSGGGRQGERIEGSLTDGGSLPGVAHEEDPRAFGAGRASSTAEPSREGDAEKT